MAGRACHFAFAAEVTEPSGAFVRQIDMRWRMDISGSCLFAGLLALAACGSDAARAAPPPAVPAAGSSCTNGAGFALSLA